MDDEGLVEVVLLTDVLQHGGVDGFVAGECCDGVTWGQEHHRVNKKGGTEENGHHLEEAFADIPEHKLVRSYG